MQRSARAGAEEKIALLDPRIGDLVSSHRMILVSCRKQSARVSSVTRVVDRASSNFAVLKNAFSSKALSEAVTTKCGLMRIAQTLFPGVLARPTKENRNIFN